MPSPRRWGFWALLIVVANSAFVGGILIGDAVKVGEADAGMLGYGLTDWEPSYCSKPYPPSFYVVDIDSYNMAVDEFNSYVRRAREYLRCVRDEAEEDLRQAKRAIEDGLADLESEIVAEVDAARSRLQTSRLLLD